MIQSSDTHSGPRATRPLTRAALLRSALDALHQARSIEIRLARHPMTLEAPHLVERLASHREIVARRAANVALAPVVPAEELGDLRDAARRLVAVTDWVTRKVGGTSVDLPGPLPARRPT